MEMTKMLLPAVPTMGKIHSNDEYAERLLYHNLKEFRKYDRLLAQLDTGTILKAVRGKYNPFDLLRYPSYDSQFTRPRRSVRVLTNEGYRYNLTTIANEKKTEIQSELQLQPKPEPQSKSEPQPKPEPEPELKSNSEAEIEPEKEPKTVIEPKPELESVPEWELGLLDWKRELELKSEPNQEPVLDYNSENEMMTTGDLCKMYDLWSDSEDEFSGKMWRHSMNSKVTFPQLDFVKRSKQKLKNVFARKLAVKRMWPILGPYRPIECCPPENRQLEVSHVQRQRYVQTLKSNQPNRSLLKSQCNVYNTLSLVNSNYTHPSNNQENILCDQNQDYQRKMVMPYAQQDSQDAEMRQLLNDDDLMEMNAEAEERLTFRHQSVHEYLKEYLSEGTSTINSSPEDTWVRRHLRRQEENQERIEESKRQKEEDTREDIMRNTLSDHSYHQVLLNQPDQPQETASVSDVSDVSDASDASDASEVSERLEVSDSDEEIDVVTYFNVPPTRRDRARRAKQVANVDNNPTVRRPRGRPPGPNSARRKKNEQINQVPDPVPMYNPGPAPRCNPSPAPKSSPGPAPRNNTGRGQNRQRTERRQNSRHSRNDDRNKKRDLHNDMERQRRTTMKQSFELVQRCIPAIADNDRVSKLAILRSAKTYVVSITAADRDFEFERKKLKEYQQMLKKKLQDLKIAKRMSTFSKKY